MFRFQPFPLSHQSAHSTQSSSAPRLADCSCLVFHALAAAVIALFHRPVPTPRINCLRQACGAPIVLVGSAATFRHHYCHARRVCGALIACDRGAEAALRSPALSMSPLAAAAARSKSGDTDVETSLQCGASMTFFGAPYLLSPTGTSSTCRQTPTKGFARMEMMLDTRTFSKPCARILLCIFVQRNFLYLRRLGQISSPLHASQPISPL